MHQTTTDTLPTRRLPGLRRTAALSAVLALGLLAPTAAGAAVGQPGPDDLTSDPGCEPDLPCEDGPDPEPCDPQTEICDFTSGGGGPDDPCEADDPPDECDPGPGGGDPDPDGGDEVVPDVDVPVRATPNFTG
jgi:hypothetical protein